jgi:dolichol-phosphate mannosyltransferase
VAPAGGREAVVMLTFIVPAFNEEQNLPRLLTSIAAAARDLGMGYRVVVIDDGSTDGTAAVAAGHAPGVPVTVLAQGTNLGVGRAFERGFQHALTLGDPDGFVVTLEGDNTSDLGILPDLVKRVQVEGFDVALASCYADGGDVEGAPLSRRVLSDVGNRLLRLAFPLSIRTWSSFYRVYRMSALRACYDAYGPTLLQERGFVCMIELLLKMAALSLTLTEVPMVLRPQNRIGKSKMKILRNIVGYFRIIYDYRLGAGRHIWARTRVTAQARTIGRARV